jgi:hypothetical protein
VHRTRPSRLRHDIRHGRKLVGVLVTNRFALSTGGALAAARDASGAARAAGMRVVTEVATLGEIVVRPAAG